jgi:hypothetical protein
MRTGPSRPITGPATRERGVSDVVAFVLVFATIIGSVTLLSTVGFQVMADYQENEQLRNAERAMGSLADNFNDLVRYDGIEQRYGELSLREGTIRTGSGGTDVTVAFENASGPDYDETYSLGEFAYESGDSVIAYEGGGIVRSARDGGSAVLERPKLTCDPDSETALVSLVAIEAGDRSIRSSGGIGVTMTVTDRSRGVYDVDAVDDEVTVSVNTEYDRAWETILDDGEWNGGTCDGVDRVVVTVVTVDVTY